LFGGGELNQLEMVTTFTYIVHDMKLAELSDNSFERKNVTF